MTVTVDFAAPGDVVFAYLVDPRNRPAWQSSLRRIEDLSGAGEVGTTWTDVTAVGARPRMTVMEVDPGRTWVEVGHWRGIGATLRLRFEPIPGGTRVAASFELRSRPVLAPAAAVLRRLAPASLRGDLRRAARTIGSGP